MRDFAENGKDEHYKSPDMFLQKELLGSFGN